MTTPVLVAYVTRYGSTQDVAEAVLATLHERGLEFGGTVRQIRNFSCVLKNTPPGV